MQPRLRFSVEYALIILILAATVYAAFAPAGNLSNWFTTDDAFYYFKTAQNIADGRGVTFDGLGLTNGFHPLWMLICIPIFALARSNLYLPLRLIILVMGALNAATTILIFRIARRVFSLPTAILLAVFWAFYTGIYKITTQLGLESGINAFCLALFLYLLVMYQERKNEEIRAAQFIWIALAAVLVLLSRLDNIFLIVILGIWVVFRSRLLRTLLLGDVLFIPLSLFTGLLIRIDFHQYLSNFLGDTFIVLALALTLKPLINLFFGLYNPKYVQPGWRLVIRTVLASGFSSGLITAIVLALMRASGFSYPRAALIFDWLFYTLLMVGLRQVAARFFNRSETGELNEAAWRPNWRHWVKGLGIYYGIVGFVLISYMAWSFSLFGTTSPVSGQIKRWWGTISTVYGRPNVSYAGIFGLAPIGGAGPWSLATDLPESLADQIASTTGLDRVSNIDNPWSTRLDWAILLLFGGVALILALSRWKLLHDSIAKLFLPAWLVGCLIQIGSYTLSGYVAEKVWYWIPEMILVLLLGGIVVEALFQILRDRKSLAGLIPWITGAACVAIFIGFGAMLATKISWNNRSEVSPYLAEAQAIEAATEPGTVIGVTGGGTIAYFIQNRTIVNMDGLINSNEYFQLMQSGHTDEYFDRIGLKYVYGSEYMLTASQPYDAMFKNRLTPVGKVAVATLFLYRP